MKINHVTVLVTDKKRALAFYRDTLGFDIKMAGESTWACVGESYIHITDNSGAPQSGSFYHFAIEDERYDERAQELLEQNVAIYNWNDKALKPIHNLEELKNHFFVLDPDGNMLEFIRSGDDFFCQR
jgi:catechol 2,3-dioxygenase-like lactoylglutathione lyase family enzyme